MDVSIMRADRADLPKILALQYTAYQSEAKLFSDQNIPPLMQTLSDIEAEFNAGIFLKAVTGDEIIGSVRGHVDGQTTYVGKLIVHPNRQGRGLGTKRLAAIERHSPTARYELFTSTRSLRNISLYERLGYKKFRERRITDELTFVYLEKIL
ncbi:MAG: GNAT family N-acetyltransferase [Selenomonadaceae bacterium]|nr:GNAT family N-acetyltransferase [Selenomonadaceae bacterium]